MRITYLVHQFFPEWYTGTEKFVFQIASMLQGAGHRVDVITYSFYERSFYEKGMGEILYHDFSYRGIPVTAIRHKVIPERIQTALDDDSTNDIAHFLLSRNRPDVIHVGHPMRVSSFISAAREFEIPYLLTLTDFWLICPKVILVNTAGDLCSGPDDLINCKISCKELSGDTLQARAENAKKILLNAKKVVSPSVFLGGFFKKECSMLDISIVHHGMSYSKIRRNEKKYASDNEIVFCYAGSLNEHKGVHLLLEAFKKITCSTVALRIYGSGTNSLYVSKVLELVRSDKRVEYRGVYSEDEIGKIFSNVDVVVAPSLWYENYPLVLHEALACATPVIASNIGGMAEKITDGVNGFTFNAGDVDSLSSVMEKIVSNPAILNVLKENIRGFLIPTVEQEAYTYYRFYKKVTA